MCFFFFNILLFANLVTAQDKTNQIETTSANSVESDLGCTSRVYFDNVTLTSEKPCQHNNKHSDVILKKDINFTYSAD